MPPIMPGTEVLDLYSFVDGLNTVKSGIRIGQTELKDCQNIRYFPVGGLMWRQGYTTLGNAPGQAATGLYMGRFSAGTNVAFRTRGTYLEKMDALDGTWDDITGAVSLTSGTDNLFSFDILNDIVIGVNGVDNPVQISSALTATTVGALPGSAIATHVYVHRGYMFYVTNDKVYFSNLNTPATVGTNNYIQPGAKTGGQCVGGVDFNGRNYVFKRNGIYAIDYQPTQVDSSGALFPFVSNGIPVVPGVGTQSPRSIVRFTTPISNKNPSQELVFFVDQFGVPRLFDGTTTSSIGESILTSRDSNILSLANINRTRLPQVWSVNDTKNYIIYTFYASSGASTGTVCFILDYRTGFAWCRDSYADAFNCGAIFENNSGEFVPYFGSYTGQVVVTGSGQSDNGVAISSYARTGDLFINKVAIRSKWLYNELRGSVGSDTQSVIVDYYVDGDDTLSSSSTIILYRENQPTWDTVNWEEFNWAYSGLTTKSNEINMEAKTLGIKVSNSILGNTATIEGMSIFAIPEGWKQES